MCIISVWFHIKCFHCFVLHPTNLFTCKKFKWVTPERLLKYFCSLPKCSLSAEITDIFSKWILHVEWIRNSYSCYCSPGDSAFLVWSNYRLKITAFLLNECNFTALMIDFLFRLIVMHLMTLCGKWVSLSCQAMTKPVKNYNVRQGDILWWLHKKKSLRHSDPNFPCSLHGDVSYSVSVMNAPWCAWMHENTHTLLPFTLHKRSWELNPSQQQIALLQ